MDDLIVPFIFVPDGHPAPKEWLARHPDAIKVRATLRPKPDNPARQGASLQFDLNSLLADAATGHLEHQPDSSPDETGETSASSEDEHADLMQQDDPISSYVSSGDAVEQYLATQRALAEFENTFASRAVGSGASDGATASAVPGTILVSGAAPAPKTTKLASEQSKSAQSANTDTGKSKSAPRLPKRMLVVTKLDGTTFIPRTKVKNKAQSDAMSLPIGTVIPIPVPPDKDPQGMVDDWRPRRMADPLTAFGWAWRPYGPNDYKRNKTYNHEGSNTEDSEFDAYGNFEYGATGASTGFTSHLLLEVAKTLHYGKNDPINENDIRAGYKAIHDGYKLGTQPFTLTPGPTSDPG